MSELTDRITKAIDAARAELRKRGVRCEGECESTPGAGCPMADLEDAREASEALALRLEGVQRERESAAAAWRVECDKNAELAQRLREVERRLEIATAAGGTNATHLGYYIEALDQRDEARLRLEEVTGLLQSWVDGGRPVEATRAALPVSPVPLGGLQKQEISVPYPASQTPEAAATAERAEHQVFTVGDGVCCAVVDELGPRVRAWVSKPRHPFAFGEFMAACVTTEDADAIAAALNRAPTTSQPVTDGARKP